MNLTTALLIVLLLTLANGLFTMSEMAIVSARETRLHELAERGDTKAKAALNLANSPNRFLPTVQIGITLIGTLTAVFGEATLSSNLAALIGRIPGLAGSSDAIASGLVVLGLTYLSLIIGELVPKRLALNSPERIATLVAIPMRFVSRVTAPLVSLLALSTDLILRLLGSNAPSGDALVTEEEILVLMRQGAAAGAFEASEQDMIERVFDLGDEPVSAILTSRLDIVWLDLNDSFEVNRQKMIETHHSQFPVCQDSLDNVLGIVHAKDVLAKSLCGEPIELTTLLRQPLFVAETTDALRLLELFKQSGTQIAMVVNEYGVTQGLVTLNDVLEIIIGDIDFPEDGDQPRALEREDGTWLVDGLLSVDEFKEVFAIEELPGEERDNYQTVGGFIITELGHIPKATDHFEWEGFRFEVVDMDGNRVDKILVIPPIKPQRPEER
jgi:putative hemolysin